jgi:hypothetical protein
MTLGAVLSWSAPSYGTSSPGQVTTPVAPTAPPIPPPAYQFDGTARATILLGEAILLVLVALWAVNKIALLGALASR